MVEVSIILIFFWLVKTVDLVSIKEMAILFMTIVMLLASCISIRGYELKKMVNADFLRIAYLIVGISTLLAYPYGEIRDVLITVICGFPAIIMGYVLVKVGWYKYKIVGALSVIGVPLLLLLTRILGDNTNGSYLQIGSNILTLGMIIMLVPFAVSYCIANEKEATFAYSTKSLPANQILLLTWTFFVATLSGMINNEYGTALIVCLTSAIVFLLYGRNIISKVIFSISSVIALGIAMIASSKLQIRWLIATNLEAAYQKSAIDSQPIRHLQELAVYYGWYGAGTGALGESIVQNITSDYSMAAILFNHGVLFTVLLLCLFVVLILNVLMMDTVTKYDKLILECISIMLIILTVLPTAGSVGSFLLTGIGVGFLSIAKSINMALFFLLGITLGIKERMVEHVCLQKE